MTFIGKISLEITGTTMVYFLHMKMELEQYHVISPFSFTLLPFCICTYIGMCNLNNNNNNRSNHNVVTVSYCPSVHFGLAMNEEPGCI